MTKACTGFIKVEAEILFLHPPFLFGFPLWSHLGKRRTYAPFAPKLYTPLFSNKKSYIHNLEHCSYQWAYLICTMNLIA